MNWKWRGKYLKWTEFIERQSNFDSTFFTTNYLQTSVQVQTVENKKQSAYGMKLEQCAGEIPRRKANFFVGHVLQGTKEEIDRAKNESEANKAKANLYLNNWDKALIDEKEEKKKKRAAEAKAKGQSEA